MVDACMLFCGFTGMRANLSKCRWLKTGEGVGDSKKLDGVQWLPVKGWKARESKREDFELVDLDVEWRYLGMVQNGHGDVDNMVKCLKNEMWDSAEVLRRKKISVAGAIYLVNTVLLPRALYRLKLSSASDEQACCCERTCRW